MNTYFESIKSPVGICSVLNRIKRRPFIGFSGSWLSPIQLRFESMAYFHNTGPRQRETYVEIKNKLLSLPLNEKRKCYACKDKYETLKNIMTWDIEGQKLNLSSNLQPPHHSKYKPDKVLNEKIGIFFGDIAALEVDVIVNAANKSLLGGGGVDAVIHNAAGYFLLDECRTLNGCLTGEAKLTGGYNLPAKYVIHTVGPFGENPLLLENCYKNSLYLAAEHKLRTIAFPCISTGLYGYPNREAATVVLETVRTFLESDPNNFDRIIFCLFMPKDKQIYQDLLPIYFPIT